VVVVGRLSPTSLFCLLPCGLGILSELLLWWGQSLRVCRGTGRAAQEVPVSPHVIASCDSKEVSIKWQASLWLVWFLTDGVARQCLLLR
jgi:hypothetical protein